MPLHRQSSMDRGPQVCHAAREEKNEDQLDRLVSEWTRVRTEEEVMATLQAAGVPAGKVLSGEGMINDPQLEHRGHHVEVDGMEIGTHHVPDWGFQLSDTPGSYRSGAPSIGQHTEFVCREILGMSDEEFVELLTEGVFE